MTVFFQIHYSMPTDLESVHPDPLISAPSDELLQLSGSTLALDHLITQFLLKQTMISACENILIGVTNNLYSRIHFHFGHRVGAFASLKAPAPSSLHY